MTRRVLAALAVGWALILLPLSTGAALAEKRVALVIGNGSYQSVAKLPNPIRDANAVAEMFKKAGFEWVKMRQDLGNLEFKRALREFMDAAQDADIAVVYYAGHGIYVHNMNYMIPVDAKLATEIDAEDEAVSLDRIVAALEPAKRLRLVILDACRDNPFARTMKRRVAMRGFPTGLANMEPTLGDALIAYAAKAGSTAEDGDGDNSPFAAALVKHLAVPGLDIRLAFGRIRDEVLKTTGNRQEPYVSGSIGGETISLVPPPAQPKVEVLSDVRGDYELVERIGTKKAWEVFLAQHKQGMYADLARAQVAKLDAEPKSVPPPAAIDESGNPVRTTHPEPPAPKPSGPSADEKRVWDRIRDSGDPARLRDFIAKYPNSPLAEAAKNRLDLLDRAAQEREDKARAEREAKARAEQEAKARAEREAKARADREAKARAEQEAKARAEQEVKARAEQEAKARADREEARRREEEARQAKSAQDRKPEDDACKRDDERLARLRGSVSQGWAREDLKRLDQETACDHIHSEVVALLTQPSPETSSQPVAPVQAPVSTAPVQAPATTAPAQGLVNTPELVLSAQSELRRLGCFTGEEDGSLNRATRDAIRRYLSEQGRSTKNIKVTDSLVADLKDQGKRVCPLDCSRGEHPEGDRCVANAKPDTQEQPKENARQRDEDEDRASKRRARREESRREREESRREERRREAQPKPERARPAARSEASSVPSVTHHSGGGGGMVGVGF